MAKKLFKKKSFWAKLPLKAKVGLIALVVALVGAGTAFALSQSDSSLQSKASLSCETSCQSACGSLTDDQQKGTCISGCMQKCNAARDEMPAICRQMNKYVSIIEKKGGLSSYQLNITKRILSKNNEDVSAWKGKLSTDNFAEWYKQRCSPKTSCDRDWSRVIANTDTKEQREVSGTRKMVGPQPTYYWPDGCRGYKSNDRMCTQALVPLSTEELVAYKKWLAAGKPNVTNVCQMSNENSRKPAPSPTPDSGCYYQKVVCIKEPCEAVLICPSETTNPTPQPKPASKL